MGEQLRPINEQPQVDIEVWLYEKDGSRFPALYIRDSREITYMDEEVSTKKWKDLWVVGWQPINPDLEAQIFILKAKVERLEGLLALATAALPDEEPARGITTT